MSGILLMGPTGIHGRPFVPFDNVPAEPGNENNGYCTHVSILFPTWHRPYLALYEASPLQYTEHNLTSADQLNSKSSTTLFNKLPGNILLGPKEINTLLLLRISEYHTGIGLLWLRLEKVSIPKVLGDHHLSV
jgi:hypothetical protein